jgi:hypothetical protein
MASAASPVALAPGPTAMLPLPLEVVEDPNATAPAFVAVRL